MATITRFPFTAHAASSATRCLIQGRAGRLEMRGTGASFWFRTLGTTLSEVPLEDLELDTMFSVKTVDRQDVSVQATLTVQITDPVAAARRMNFNIDLARGEWTTRPLQELRDRVIGLARQYAARTCESLPLPAVLQNGLTILPEAIAAGLAEEQNLRQAGINVASVRVVAVRPDEELERALQNKVREAVQAESDRATYERRAQAVERERAIKENELNNRTELARREAELVELSGANERRRTEQDLEREQLRADAILAHKRLEVDARVDEVSRVADAENTALAARMTQYEGADTSTLIAAIAPQVLAALPAIDSLTITPDMLSNALGRLLAEAKTP